jgi:hypothetical protein
MKIRPVRWLVGLAALTAGIAMGANTHALMIGDGASDVIGELNARGNVRVAQEGSGMQLDVSNSRYPFFSGDGVATGAGAHAMLDLANGGAVMFSERTGGAFNLEGGRVAGVLDSGFICYGVPDRDAEMVIASGPYTFSVDDAGSGFMAIVDDAVQVRVRGGILTVRDAAGTVIATLGPTDEQGFSITDPGTLVAASDLDDPCTGKGFAWYGPHAPIAAGPPLYVAPAPAVATAGGVIAEGLVYGVAAGVVGGAILGSDSDSDRPEPVSP